MKLFMHVVIYLLIYLVCFKCKTFCSFAPFIVCQLVEVEGAINMIYDEKQIIVFLFMVRFSIS